jgi:thioredoxin reductase (NADPH)
MSEPKPSVLETRRDQMFPTLTTEEIDRILRFGECSTYKDGEFLSRTGEVVPGIWIILAGQVAITRKDGLDEYEPIVTHGPGDFSGELAQLSGRPSLVDAQAVGDVIALLITSNHLREVMIAEAELGERIMRALILRRVGLIEVGGGGPVIIGHPRDRNVLRLEEFLRRNGHPHSALDPETDSCARTLIERFHIEPNELPIVVCPDGEFLRNPTEIELAECISLLSDPDPSKIYDVAIIGAGPAGLAAAVYAGSEGLSVLVLDCHSFGGQAGASARIENYMGFPTGISGLALTARAYNQALKFGVEMAIPSEVFGLDETPQPSHFTLSLSSDAYANARSVVIASGARYRKLNVDNLEEFESSSVHYWASPLEARLCAGQEVALVGAGNSAGQAAVYLASQVAKVLMIVRGPSLETSMSRYLINRIASQPNIEVLTETEICALEGTNGNLSSITLCDRKTDLRTERPMEHVFLFIGAEPNSGWLAAHRIVLDEKGFIRTGADLGNGHLPMETSRSGIFAIGDVRAGSVKRVASAVGEGAQVVATIHRYLAGVSPISLG